MEEYLCFMVELEAMLCIDGGVNPKTREKMGIFVIASAAVVSMAENANTNRST
jgi:hypothetical protein